MLAAEGGTELDGIKFFTTQDRHDQNVPTPTGLSTHDHANDPAAVPGLSAGALQRIPEASPQRMPYLIVQQ
jgi:hypothetical protein